MGIRKRMPVSSLTKRRIMFLLNKAFISSKIKIFSPSSPSYKGLEEMFLVLFLSKGLVLFSKLWSTITNSIEQRDGARSEGFLLICIHTIFIWILRIKNSPLWHQISASSVYILQQSSKQSSGFLPSHLCYTYCYYTSLKSRLMCHFHALEKH